jgi:ATP-dependent Clp protease adaptor protein ClpS
MTTSLDLNYQLSDSTETTVLDYFTYNLIVWNDDVNTFDWVITSLMEVCDHTEEQAEQCAMFIHFQGKYAVKKGDTNTLSNMCHALLDRGINATVEEVAIK